MTVRAYCSCTRPNPPPPPRDPPAIAGDVRAAARVLEGVADDLAAEAWNADTLADADAVLIGLHRLLCELRQHGKDGAPCYD